RGHQGGLRRGRVGIGIGEEVSNQHDQVEADDDDPTGNRHAMLLEAPPHQLPLRRHEDALFLPARRRNGHVDGHARRVEDEIGPGHQESSSRMRGSTHTSRMSEISVPITVMTPSRSTMVPAKNMSCGMSDFRRSGPTVGSPSTSDTMMLPDTMYGSV